MCKSPHPNHPFSQPNNIIYPSHATNTLPATFHHKPLSQTRFSWFARTTQPSNQIPRPSNKHHTNCSSQPTFQDTGSLLPCISVGHDPETPFPL